MQQQRSILDGMPRLWEDLRYATRILVKTPGVTLVALVSLALGIGANTAIFTLINAVLLRSLPVPDPQQLVEIATTSPDSQNGKDGLSFTMFEEIRKRQQVFSGLFIWSGGGMSNFEANGMKYAASLNVVSGDYFSTLGVKPVVGRLITAQDAGLDTASPAAVAVLGYGCWQKRYNGDPAVVGKTIRVDDRPLTILGVTPKGFTGPLIDAASDATVPFGFTGSKTYRERRVTWLDVMARLKPGVTVAQARAQLEALWPAIREATVPEEFNATQRAGFSARRIDVQPGATGHSYMRQRVLRPLAVLMALVAVVLLIACVNLANLMLARAAGRSQEIGIRIALGAGGWNLVRQLLAESVTLSLGGAALGLVVAFWTTRLLSNVMWIGYVPMGFNLQPDLRVLAFTAAVAVLTGIGFGLAPAWTVIRTDPAGALKQNARTVQGGGGSVRKLLVSAQVGLSLALVIGASLFVRSLENLRTVDTGYRRDGILQMQLFPQAGREKIPNRTQYYRQLVERLAQLPGVEAVSYSHMGPGLRYEFKQPVSVPSSAAAPVRAVQDYVGPGFFRLIGMRVLAGREFDWRDDENAPRAAIVSESLARRLFPGENPSGRKIDVGSEPAHKDIQIIGVVNSASLWKAESREPMAVYVALMQEPRYNQSMIDIRFTGNVEALAPAARQTLESMGHHYPLRMQTLRQRLDSILTNERMIAMLSTFFAGLALLLASVGLYGVMSYTVTRRTPEIGVRMALGAQRGSVVRLILREVMVVVFAGIAAGVLVALAASRLISGMLFGLAPNDPVTIAFSVIGLTAVALFAGYLPARRAARIDPMAALGSE